MNLSRSTPANTAIADWQNFLNTNGARDDSGAMLVEDGNFGPRTEQATKRFQAMNGLATTGELDAPTRAYAAAMPFVAPSMLFIPAKHFRRGRAGAEIELLIFHTSEFPEKRKSAITIAQFFTNPIGPSGPVVTSAGYAVDNERVVQMVHDDDTSWHTPGKRTSGAYVNDVSIGIEHAGYAAQTAAEWSDPFSKAMLGVSAKLFARLCKEHNLPPVWLDDVALKSGANGITGHVQCSRAFGGSHTDPGAGFDSAGFAGLVNSFM